MGQGLENRGTEKEPWNIPTYRGTQEKDDPVEGTDGTATELGRLPGECNILEATWSKYFKEDMINYAIFLEIRVHNGPFYLLRWSLVALIRTVSVK